MPHNIHWAPGTNLPAAPTAAASARATGAAQRPSLTLDANGQPLLVWTEITSAGSDIEAAHYLPAANGGLGGWVELGSSLSTGGLSGTGNADFASVVNTASGPVVAWLDRSSGTAQVYARLFNGTSWTPLGAGAASGGGITQASSDVLSFSLATDGSKVGVAWSQRISGVSQVFVSQYSGGAWSGVAGSNTGNGISNTLGDSTAPTIAYSGGSLFVAWQGDTMAPFNIYADIYNGTTWMAAGAGASSGGGISNSVYQSMQPHLSQGGGVLTLTWVEDLASASNQSALYTRIWNGSAFVEQLPGDASFNGVQLISSSVQQIATTVDASGHPYIAWQTSASGTPGVYLIGNVYTPGTTYYVNGNATGGVFTSAAGSASNTGLSPTSPLASIQQVFSNYTLHPGDLILVDSGTYSAPLTVPTAANGVLIFGAPRG